MSEDVAFQIDILFQNIPVAVGLGDELAAFAIDEKGGFTIHGFDCAQASTVILVGSRRDSVLRH